MTIYNDNAVTFASRPETRVPMERRSAVVSAMRVIREYRDTEHAAALLLDSVHRQARWSGGIVLEQTA